MIASARAGLWKADLEKAFPRVAELPFDLYAAHTSGWDRRDVRVVHDDGSSKLEDCISGFPARHGRNWFS